MRADAEASESGCPTGVPVRPSGLEVKNALLAIPPQPAHLAGRYTPVSALAAFIPRSLMAMVSWRVTPFEVIE
jgi:hypothetical protein